MQTARLPQNERNINSQTSTKVKEIIGNRLTQIQEKTQELHVPQGHKKIKALFYGQTELPSRVGGSGHLLFFFPSWWQK